MLTLANDPRFTAVARKYFWYSIIRVYLDGQELKKKSREMKVENRFSDQKKPLLLIPGHQNAHGGVNALIVFIITQLFLTYHGALKLKKVPFKICVWLHQRLKSMFFEIYSNEAAMKKEACGVKKKNSKANQLHRTNVHDHPFLRW